LTIKEEILRRGLGEVLHKKEIAEQNFWSGRHVEGDKVLPMDVRRSRNSKRLHLSAGLDEGEEAESKQLCIVLYVSRSSYCNIMQMQYILYYIFTMI
jgi:hypothetical protein